MNSYNLQPSNQFSGQPSRYVVDTNHMHQTHQQFVTNESPQQFFNFHTIFRIIFKHRSLIAITALIVLAFTALYSFLATRMYVANATLKIGTYAPLLPGASIEDTLRQQTSEADYLNTQVRLLSGFSLVDKVVSDTKVGPDILKYLNHDPKKIRVYESSYVNDGDDVVSYKTPVSILKQYLDLVNVSAQRKTSLVIVNATTSDPVLSAKIANYHSKAFIDLIREGRQKVTLENLVFLKSQAEDLASSVAQTERDLAAYAEEHAIVSLNDDENIVVNKMAELSQILTSVTAERVKIEQTLKEFSSNEGLSSTALDDETIKQVRFSLREAEAEYARLIKKFKPTYPKMVQLKSKIQTLKSSLGDQRRQSLKSLKTRYQAKFEEEKELMQLLEIQKSKTFELSRKQVQYNIMKRDYESLKDLHQAVLRQLKEAQISAESSGTNIAVVERAAVPLEHSTPKRLQNIIFALIIGPFLGLILASVLESLDNTVKDPDDVLLHTGLPSLGMVPRFESDNKMNSRGSKKSKRLEIQGGSDTESIQLTEDMRCEEPKTQLPAEAPLSEFENLITVETPQSIASESFRAIRTGILLSSADNPPKKIMVSSAHKGEGKTTLITNLAVTLAQTSNKVILIDSDLRRPKVAKQFNLESSLPGLVEYLTGSESIDQYIRPTGIDNLDIITSGTRPPNPAELVASMKMEALIEFLATKYDHILIDTSPVLPVTDGVVMSRLVDGVILVVRSQHTKNKLAREAAGRLKQVGAKMLGVVLNDINFKKGDYAYYYGDVYSYNYE